MDLLLHSCVVRYKGDLAYHLHSETCLSHFVRSTCFFPATDTFTMLPSAFDFLQFCDAQFGELSGARVVRIATHPDYQNLGYGTRAIQLLHDYYAGKVVSKQFHFLITIYI